MHEIKQKLVYILPEYRDYIATHFYHNVELLERASDKLDIFLILEKGQFPKSINNGYCQRFKFWPLRILELALVFAYLRARGFDTVWTHYYFLGSILGSYFF